MLLELYPMRRRELTRLTVGDYDSREHTLTIRESKFHKSRRATDLPGISESPVKMSPAGALGNTVL